jgi:hypothetical protein
MVKRAGLILAVIGAAVIGTSGSAAASTGGPAYSKEQAGYSVTGARFKEVEVNVRLPVAGRFAANTGQVGWSVQLWSKHLVVDLRLAACTDASCRAGGQPADREYRLGFTVYSRSTRAVLCSTAASTCPQVPASWNRARYHSGRTVGLTLFFDPNTGYFQASAPRQLYIGYTPGTGAVFSQARIGVEFGATPWSVTPVKLPAHRTAVATFGVSAGPAREAEFVTYSGRAGCINAPWYAYHRLQMTSTGSAAGRQIAAPLGLSNLGCNFTVYLRP